MNPYLVHFRKESRANFLAMEVVDGVKRRHGGLKCLAWRARDQSIRTSARVAAGAVLIRYSVWLSRWRWWWGLLLWWRGRTWSGATVLNKIHNHRMSSSLLMTGNVFMTFWLQIFFHFSSLSIFLHRKTYRNMQKQKINRTAQRDE